ncbi:MAG: glycerophosphodiester phosphodiesterase [Candidatus Nanopelagicales bacterium]
MYPEHPFYFAHRGGNETASENSLCSFLTAYSLGCRYLELDLQSTKDNRLLVFHDPNLQRVTGSNVDISHSDYQTVRNIKYPHGEEILVFEELVKALPEDANFNIDPKSDQAAHLLSSFLKMNAALQERVSIGTFSTRRVQLFRKEFPNLVTVASRNEVIGALIRFLSGISLNTKANALQIPLTPYFRPHLRAEFAEYLHEQGLQVHVWTVNHLEDMQMLYARGFDAVMTDKPSLAQKYFDSRQGL